MTARVAGVLGRGWHITAETGSATPCGVTEPVGCKRPVCLPVINLRYGRLE